MRIHWLLFVLLMSSPFIQSSPVTSTSSPSLSSVNLGTVPRGVAVDSSSGTVYVVLYLNGTTLALDPQTFKTVSKVATPSPYAIAANSNTHRIYVSQGEGSSVAVIDGSNNSIVASVRGAGTPYALAVDETQNLVFAADTSENSLWIVDGSADVVVARLPMGDSSALAVDPGMREAFVANLSSDFKAGVVDVVDTNSREVVRTVPVHFPPGHFAVDTNLHLLFVTSAGAGGPVNFIALDDRTFQIAYSLHLGDSPGIVTTASSRVYVSDPGADRLYELDGASGQVLLNSTGDQTKGISFAGITGMAYNPNTGELYVTENDDTDLVVLDAGVAPPSPYAGLLYPAVLVIILAVAFAVILVSRGSAKTPRVRTAES